MVLVNISQGDPRFLRERKRETDSGSGKGRGEKRVEEGESYQCISNDRRMI